MKKRLLLLLFIPLVSFAQVNSFEDLKTINSLEQFKRVLIENRYEIYTLMVLLGPEPRFYGRFL